MIKSIISLSIKDYNLFDTTGNVKYLLKKRWFSYIPSFFVSSRIEREATVLTEIIDKRMSDVDVIEEQNKELEETRETAEIFLLEICYKALFKVFYINTHINACCAEFDITQKQTEDYKYYKDIVEKITYKVVEINSEKDLKGFKNDLYRRIQKHKEKYPIELNTNETKEKQVTFYEVVTRVFQHGKISVDNNMSLDCFFKTKDIVVESIREEQKAIEEFKQKNSNNNG